MKLAIATFSTAFILATGASAEVDVFEFQAEAQAASGYTTTQQENAVTLSDGVSHTGNDKFETVFSSKDRAESAHIVTGYEGR